MMAKRSDFAQKLLDDLRMRKEKMASSQSSSRTNTMAGDAHSYSKHTYKGSKFTYHTVGSKMGDKHRRSSGGSKSLASENNSYQIVPFGRDQRPEQLGDLSMALAFALENGGKFKRMDSSGSTSMLGFLQQISRGSVDFRNMERSSSFHKHQPSHSQFPTLSHLHVKEISKGAQKLNQILRACSNGLNFDGYSIEIGKELLKGAMDLEESLRMLVNLQDASEYMVKPQRKSRIRLLEGDEDDDENTLAIVEQKQLDRPRFSFDKPSANSYDTQEASTTGLKQRLAALPYSTKASNFNHTQQTPTTSHSASHRRLASLGPDVKAIITFSEQKSHSSSTKSKPEKKGIPNVIAKLMGLDELPEHVESEYITPKKSSSKQKTEGTIMKKKTAGSTTYDEGRINGTENLPLPTSKQKVISANKISIPQDTTIVTAKTLLTSSSSLQMVKHDGKKPWTDSENVKGVNPMKGLRNATIKTDKEDSNVTQMEEFTASQKDTREKESANQREQTGEGKHETKAAVSKNDFPGMAQTTLKNPETVNIYHEKIWRDKSTPQTEKRSTDGLPRSNQYKPHNDHRVQQKNVLGVSEPQEEKRLPEEKDQQTAKQKLKVRKQKTSEADFRGMSKPMHDRMELQKKSPTKPIKRNSEEAIDAAPSRGSPGIRHRDDLVKDENTTSSKVRLKDSVNRNSGQIVSPIDLEADPDKGADFAKAKAENLPIKEEKLVQVPNSQKKNGEMRKNGTPRKIYEVLTRENANLQRLPRPMKNHISVLQETKHKRSEKINGPKKAEQLRPSRSKEAEVHIIKSKKPEASILPLNVEHKIYKEVEQGSFYNPVEVGCQSLTDLHFPAPNDSNQIITLNVSCQEEGQVLASVKDQELTAHTTSSSPSNEIHERSISNPSKVEQQKVYKSRKEQPLTEDQIHLKQILILNQLFLNTAEALFKLNIPVGLLHASGHSCQDEDSKIILDCGYEVMKRKGRRQELIVHPFMRTSISSMKVRSFDDLVKELHKDFQKLKFYGRNGSNESDPADYIPKMLEKDFENRDPDLNCMWDFGWNEMMFTFIEKDDVMRDVERHVLDGLIDDITTDFIHVSIHL